MGDAALTELELDPAAVAAVATPEPVATTVAPLDDAGPAGVSLRSATAAKLAAAMFLHHFSVSAWIVTLGNYVQAHTGSAGSGMFAAGFVGIAYSAGPLGSMVAPFLTGLLADHLFATERIMAALNLGCAAALGFAVAADSPTAFYLALLGYFVCFTPSFALTSSMTLHHLATPARDYPAVRAFSTMGWIAGGVLVGWAWPAVTGEVIESTAVPMKIGMVAALATAAFCLMLPHTPPANKHPSGGGISLRDTLELMRQGRFLALIVIAVLAHAPSQFYYAYGNVYLNWLGMSHPAAKLTLGQATEVVMMFLLPLVLLRVSVRASVVVGLSAWAIRSWMLAAAADAAGPSQALLLYAAIAAHGVAFTLTSIALQLDVDRCAGRRRRATAQGLLAVAMSGAGCFLGAQLAGIAGARLLPEDLAAARPADWAAFWALPGWGAAGVAAAALILLRPGRGHRPPPP